MLDTEAKYYEERINRFVDYLPNLFYRESVPFEIDATVDAEPIPFASLSHRFFQPMYEGQKWGENWHSGWFRLRGMVPAEWQGKTVVARLNFGGEACIFSPEGEPLFGLTGMSAWLSPFERDRYDLFAPCEGGEEVNLLVEAAANELFGVAQQDDPIPDARFVSPAVGVLKCIRLCTFDEAIFTLWLDASFLSRLMKSLPARDPWRARILHTMGKAVNAFHYGAPNADEVRAILAPLLTVCGSDAELTATAVGHAHIDTAWVWPMRESIRKCARTFATQLRLMEQYPDYVFGASQAQHYQFVKDRYPGLYARIKQAVADGRWEVQGAMWVEADCNLTSGESLVRQILLGKRFFRDEFGIDVKDLWLPDVFGYSAALPQILRLAGVETFLTQKLSWSQFNKFPHHTFIWKGIDGTGILSHFPPENNYNGQLQPDRLRFAAENYEERGFLPGFMTLFGIGDGGGGPTEQHIEYGLRQRDLAGCPRVRFGHAQSFFDMLHEHEDELAVWQGELYLELHRGTLTTQAKNKLMNRRLELQLRRIEILWASLPLADYPQAELDACWKTLLVNQFHDILPGSGITWVYQDSRRDYARLSETLDALEQRALDARKTEGTEELTIANTLSHRVVGAVYLPGVTKGVVQFEDGQRIPVQPDGEGGSWISIEMDGMAVDHARIHAGEGQSTTGISADEWLLENDLVRYEFDENGRLVRVFDKEVDREVMRAGEEGNVLSLYEDWPAKWDAWDIDRPYWEQLRDSARLQSAAVLANGPHLAALKFEFAIGESTISQEVRLAANSKRLDFVTTVQWAECRKMLRVAFPVDVMAQQATFEIQFGTLKRPTHENTSWDAARFEVCGHRFADLSEEDYGVALLNDCKYGYRVHGHVLDLNLLRAPYSPDATADRGEQHFTYSLLPHACSFEQSNVVAEAHALNQPPLVVPGNVALMLPFRVDDGVVLDSVKKAECEDAWVLRLYEPLGRRVQCVLHCENRSTDAWEAGVMEDRRAKLEIMDGEITLAFRPFEIKTVLIR